MTILETGIATPSGPEFNPFDPQFLADLYPFFAEYRACAGFLQPSPGLLGTHTVRPRAAPRLATQPSIQPPTRYRQSGAQVHGDGAN